MSLKEVFDRADKAIEGAKTLTTKDRKGLKSSVKI